MASKLIIAPHIDDEVLGCGGILDSDSHVYVCGVDESGFRPDKDPTPNAERLEEMNQAAAFLGYSWEYNPQSRVNRYTEQELIDLLEDVVNRVKPDRIYLPHPGFNQDHRTVFHASMVALRPHDRNFFVNKVLVYEAIHDLLWDPAELKVNHFVEIDIERKLQAYLFHQSQVRRMRSPEVLRHMAAVRGAAINRPYAEAFQILRWAEVCY
jgi:LmbE family N-acetylglucosaminyl deacetylase